MIDPGARRILVVDDEPINRRLIHAILAVEDHEIVEATNGAEALEIVAGGCIDLVLLDVMMPGIDGIEVCRRIREMPAERYLPIVLVSALADASSRTRGKAAGADDFLTKPVHEDELLARTRNLLALVQYQELVEVQRRAAEGEARLWKLVSRVATAVGACRDYAGIYAAIEAALAADLPFDSSTVILIDGDRLSVHAVGRDLGASPFATRRWDPRWWNEPLRSSRALRVQPGDHDAAPFSSILAEAGYGDGVLIPVIGAGELHALLLLARYYPFDDADLALLRMLSPHLGNAVGNVRLHLRSQQLLLAREELSNLLVHDLKNPLSVVRINLDLASMPHLSSADRDAAVADAARAADRVIGMVTDLLDAGAAEEGRLEIARARVRIGAVVEEAVGVFASSVRGRGAEVAIAIDAGVEADVDRKLLRRVVENLVGNAVRFVPKGGRIELAVERVGDAVRIRVSNDGSAIPDEVRAGLFGKYGGTRDGKGSARGLGLYFCRLVIEGHGGTIAALPRADGATFEIVLPARAAADAADVDVDVDVDVARGAAIAS